MSYLCLCGHVIKNNLPTQFCGDLKWEPESERASQDFSEALKDFFAAVEKGEKDEWLREFFNVGDILQSPKSEDTQSTEQMENNFYLCADLSSIITDVFSRFENREGLTVYRCPESERLYIQKQYFSDDYECYEKGREYSR